MKLQFTEKQIINTFYPSMASIKINMIIGALCVHFNLYFIVNHEEFSSIYSLFLFHSSAAVLPKYPAAFIVIKA